MQRVFVLLLMWQCLAGVPLPHGHGCDVADALEHSRRPHVHLSRRHSDKSAHHCHKHLPAGTCEHSGGCQCPSEGHDDDVLYLPELTSEFRRRVEHAPSLLLESLPALVFRVEGSPVDGETHGKLYPSVPSPTRFRSALPLVLRI